MDVVDRAQADIDTIERLKSRHLGDKKEAEETGYCLFCEEPLPKGRRWCNSECRDAWEKERRFNKYR